MVAGESSWLYAGADGLSLPSLMPEAVAAEAALRFTHVDFRLARSVADLALPSSVESRREASKAITALDETFGPWSSTCRVPVLSSRGAVRVGADAIVSAASAFNSGTQHVRLDAGFTTGQAGLTSALTSLVRSTVFPAFEYCLYGEDAAFDAVRPAIHARLSTWERLTSPAPSRRAVALRRLADAFGLRHTDHAVKLARSGLEAMERLIGQHHQQSLASSSAVDDESPVFFFGGRAPGAVDAFVFAAVTIAASARFPASSAWSEMQMEDGLTLDVVAPGTSQAFPLLCRYARLIAKRYYEQYAGLHFLNLPPQEVCAADANQALYAKGRRTVIAVTALASVAYMLVANAQVLLAVLQAMIDVAEQQDQQQQDQDGESTLTHGEDVVAPNGQNQ